MKKSIIIFLILIFVFVMILSGCSKNKSKISKTPINTLRMESDESALQTEKTSGENEVISNDDRENGAVSKSDTTEAPADDGIPEGFTKISLPMSEIYTGDLISVNKNHSYSYKLTSVYTPSELDTLSSPLLKDLGWTSLYSEKSGNFLLRSRLIFMKTKAYEAFEKMMGDFVKKTGKKDVQVLYSYRLINDSKDSVSLSDERITGLVVEINVYTPEGTFAIEHSSKKNEYFKWFSENCANYGFIMTGESGYFRYVGIPHARYVYENSLDLKSYLERLGRYSFDDPLTIDSDGKTYKVYYQKASENSDTEIIVPESLPYSVSGDNYSGLIVTVG